MTIEYINTGTIANDGTGDDLREAFTKINDNFEELDLRIVEETVIENNGSLGEGIYSGKVDGIHGLKRLRGGNNISLLADANGIQINGVDALTDLSITTDSGTITIIPGGILQIQGGDGVQTRENGSQLVVELASSNIVSSDAAPVLSGSLNANTQNIIGANEVRANTFVGYLDGLVRGYDVAEFGPYLSGFDFGTIRNTYNNALEFILATVDLDFGTIDPDVGDTVDLGYIV